jgi:hypothetical protein
VLWPDEQCRVLSNISKDKLYFCVWILAWKDARVALPSAQQVTFFLGSFGITEVQNLMCLWQGDPIKKSNEALLAEEIHPLVQGMPEV